MVSVSSMSVMQNDDDITNNAYEIKVCANDDRWGKIIYRNENKQEENEVENEDSLEKYADRENIVLPSAYFPAFRNMIEAWKSI